MIYNLIDFVYCQEMNNCIKELGNITRIQNIQLVRNICQDKGWNPEPLITMINSRDNKYYKNLFDSVVEDELNNCFQQSVIIDNDKELKPYILDDTLYYIDKTTTNIYTNNLIPIDIKMNQIRPK